MNLLTQKTLTHVPLQNSNGLLSNGRAMALVLVVGLILFLVIISNPNPVSRFLTFSSSPGDLKWKLVHGSSFAHAASLDQVVLTGNGEGWALTWAELAKVQDNGKTWTPILSNDQPGRESSAFYSFTFTSPKTGFVVGTQEKGSGYTVLILKTTDGGETWEERPTDVKLESDFHLSPRLQSVSFCNQTTGWAVGGELILHTTDGGESWQQQQSYFNKDQTLLTVACVSSERALAVGTGGLLLQTNNGGDTWTHKDLGTKEFLTRVRFFGDNGWIIGGALEKGLLFRTHDGGNNWTQQKLDPSTGLLFDIFFLGSNGWIAAENGTLLRSADAGETWTRQEVPTTESLTSLFFLSPTQGWIGGDRLTLLRLSSVEAELKGAPAAGDGKPKLSATNSGYGDRERINPTGFK